MKIAIISGAIANKPFNGGATWTRLSWLLGFRKLGFDAYFVEQVDSDAPDLAYFREVVSTFGLDGKAALICPNPLRVEGMDCHQLLDVANHADLLINISGHLTIEALKSPPAVKVYIDLDPGFTQFWHESGASSRLDGHDYFFTVGENIGTAACSIPTGGIPWRPVRQPAVLEEWPVCPNGGTRRFTTIASWRGPFGPVEYGGRTFGSKVREFRKYAPLPTLLDEQFEIALDIHPLDARDRELLRGNSWKLADPHIVARDPIAFRRYVQESGAEFSVAQEIYVQTGSGWFSDRSVRYLASGKPVLAEDTGFSRNYPVGDGLLTFSSLEEAAAGVHRITTNYRSHATAARQIAETYFDSGRVLGELVDQIGVCP